MTRTRLSATLALLAIATVGPAACGGDDEDEDATPPPAATQTEQTSTAGERDAAASAIEVAADPGGDLAFVQDTLTAKAGSVTFDFTNEASVPHDFNIERDGEDIAGTEVIANDSETLKTDLEAGEYAYYCSVANHREAGMEGTLTVK